MRDQEDKSEDRGGKVRASEREEVGSQISKFHSLFGGKSSIPLDSMAIPSFKFILIEKKQKKNHISWPPTSISISDSVSLAWPALYRL